MVYTISVAIGDRWTGGGDDPLNGGPFAVAAYDGSGATRMGARIKAMRMNAEPGKMG